MTTPKRAHARIYRCWLEEPAWRELRGQATKLLVHFLARHRPQMVGFTFTDADASTVLSCHPDTARKALLELDRMRFIRIDRGGGLTGPRANRARYIRLLTYPAGQVLSPPRSRMPFGRINESWLLLPAWRDMSGLAAKLLVDLLARHEEGGDNSWRLEAHVVRERLGCGRETAYRVLRELIALGWLRSESCQFRKGRYSLSQFASATHPPEAWRYERWIMKRRKSDIGIWATTSALS